MDIEDHPLLPEAEEFLYPAQDLFPPKTIRTFKYTKDWLKNKIIKTGYSMLVISVDEFMKLLLKTSP